MGLRDWITKTFGGGKKKEATATTTVNDVVNYIKSGGKDTIKDTSYQTLGIDTNQNTGGGGSGGGSSGGGGGGSGRGSYNTSTNTYTSPTGNKMSMAQSYVPKGTKIITTTPTSTLQQTQQRVNQQQQIRQKAIALQQNQPQNQFTGKFEETGTGKTTYVSQGKTIAVTNPNTGTFTPAQNLKKAKFTFNRGGNKEVVNISKSELVDREFQRRQQSAGELLWGGENIQSRIQLPSEGVDIYQQPIHATRTDLGVQKINQPVYPPGTIYSYQSGTTESGVPVYKIYTINKNWNSRPATAKEVSMLNPSTERIGKGPNTRVGKEMGEVIGRFKKFSKEPYAPGQYISKGINRYTSNKGKVINFAGGVVSGLVPSTKGGFITTAASFGVGAAVGAGVRGGSYVLSRIPKYGTTIAKTFKLGTYTGGLVLGGLYAGQKVEQVYYAPTYIKKGQIVGESIREVGAFGAGSYAGAKGFDIYQGWRNTRGRTFLETKQGVYPSANPKTHLRLFRTNVIKGLSYEEYTPSQKMDLAKEYAKFNLKQQLEFKEKSVYPSQHAYPHMKEVGVNIQKIIKVYPEYKPYLIKEYGSLKGAKTELTKAMWHDLLKVGSSSKNEFFGKGHGEVFYDLWKSGKLPKDLNNIKPKVAEAIRYHEITSVKNPSVEWKILATADRLQFSRFKGGVDISKLPLSDAMNRIVKLKSFKFYEPKVSSNYIGDFTGKYKISGGEIYPLNAKPGAFHTTGNSFWGSGVLTPGEGTSELKGLYGSTYVSTKFAKILGKGSKPKLIPSLKDIFSIPKKPGVAFSKPKGFRESPVGFSRVKQFKGQRYIKGKGYAYFKKPAKPGYADISGIKSEIEAVFRPEAGSYGIESKKYYVKIEGVRVPLDVLKYDSSLPKGTGNLVKGGASSYPGYKSPSYLNPITGYSLVPNYKNMGASSVKVSKVDSYLRSVSGASYTYSPVSSRSYYVSSKVPSSKIPLYSYKTPSYIPKSYGKISIKSLSKVSPSGISSFISSKSLTPSRSYAPKSKKETYLPYLYSKSKKKYLSSYIYPHIQSSKPVGLKKFKQPKPFTEIYKVFGRRFGKFKEIGVARTPTGAVGIGKKWARNTLGVSFKVPKFKGLKIPGFKTKKEKGQTVFIEPIGKRLKRGTKEIPEIKYWKEVKGGKRKSGFKKSTKKKKKRKKTKA